MRKQDIVASSTRYEPSPPSISVVYNSIGQPYNNATAMVTFLPPFDGKLPISSYTSFSTPTTSTRSVSTPLTNGLYGRRYNGYYADDVSFFTIDKIHGDEGTYTSINNFTSNADFYTWMFVGYFYAPTTGTYTFYTTSDDSSLLWVGNQALSGWTLSNLTVDNRGLHGPTTASGTVSLTGGQYYPIRLTFGENGGGDIVTLEFAGPGISRTSNGVGYYFTSVDTYANIIPNPVIPMPGLLSATSYTFSGFASNPVGPSATVTTGAITITTVPQNPGTPSVSNIVGIAFVNNPNISASFTAGASGGSSITSYQYSTDGGTTFANASGTTSPFTLTLQSNGSAFAKGSSYNVILRAINANGTSANSGTSNNTVAGTAPQTPTIGTATRVNNSTATVNWTPNSNGGYALSSLTVESSPSISLSYTNTDFDGSVNVTGSFASNQSYSFRVRTANANGNSDFSGFSNSIIVNVPASYFNPPVSYFNPPAPSYFNPPTPGYFNPPQTYFNPPAPSYFNPPAPSYFNPPPAYFNPPSYFNPPPSYFNPPKAPSFKCIYANSKVLTNKGYVLAKDIKVGDKLITVDSSNFTNVETLSNMMISESIKFTETEVVKNIAGRKTLIRFNDFEEIFSNQQPIFVKNGDGIKYKNTGEVTVDDILVRVNVETGNVYYVPVEKIEVMEQDDVYEIRTNPHLWFIVGESLVIS